MTFSKEKMDELDRWVLSEIYLTYYIPNLDNKPSLLIGKLGWAFSYPTPPSLSPSIPPPKKASGGKTSQDPISFVEKLCYLCNRT